MSMGHLLDTTIGFSRRQKNNVMSECNRKMKRKRSFFDETNQASKFKAQIEVKKISWANKYIL